MKKLFTLILMTLSVAAMADIKVTGTEAQKLFNELAGQYEYTSGARTTGLSINTVTRHDNGTITCSRDIVKYNTGAEQISYECILKS